jgi:hypothetical protein
MGTAAAFITTTNGWTTSVTVNIAARSMTVTAGTSCDVVMGLLLEFTNSIDLVGILLAQDNNTGGGDDSIYPEGWYGTAVRFVALTNRNASVVLTPLGNSLPSRDGSVYLPLTGGTNTSAGTESMSRATGVLTLSYSASTSILTGYYDGTAVSSYCLAGWGLNPPLTLSVFGNSEVESVVVSEGTVTGSNFYAGLLPVLSVNATGANLVLSWLTNAAGFTLQSATNLVSAVWSTNLPSPLVVGGQNIVTNPITGSQNFFRLISN